MPGSSTTWTLAGRQVRITSPDKPYWPDDGLTKGDLLAYYRDVAPVLLPYCAGRPVTLRVFPDDIHGDSYYRRERPDHAPPWLRSADYQTATDGHLIHALLVDDAAGLVWLANAGAIEFHLWGSRLPDLDEPDQAIFDLDPGEQATFADVLQALEDCQRPGRPHCIVARTIKGYPIQELLKSDPNHHGRVLSPEEAARALTLLD